MRIRKRSQGIQITSQEDAVSAFANGVSIPKSQRWQVVKKFFKAQANISLGRACTLAIKYGLGLLHETGTALNKLALAWLRIGEQAWRKIVAQARNFDWVSISYSSLCRKLRMVFLHTKPAWAW